MSRFALGVDGGGTKTLARLEDLDTGQTWQVQTGPASLTNDLSAAIEHVLSAITTVMRQGKAKAPQTALAIGIAGAGDPAACLLLEEALPPNFFWHKIESDALTSCLGAGQGKPVVAVALGTGSVAVRLDENRRHHIVGGWGFLIGDEGGGASLGKAAVREALWEFDGEGERSTLTAAIYDQIGSVRHDIIQWLKRASPTDFAQLAPLVVELAERCDRAEEIMRNAARDVDLTVTLTLGKRDIPVCLLGGLADAFYPYLKPTTKAVIRTPLGTSLDGACMLAKEAWI